MREGDRSKRWRYMRAPRRMRADAISAEAARGRAKAEHRAKGQRRTATIMVGDDVQREREGDGGHDREVGRSPHIRCPLHAGEHRFVDLAHEAEDEMKLEAREACDPGETG